MNKFTTINQERKFILRNKTVYFSVVEKFGNKYLNVIKSNRVSNNIRITKVFLVDELRK